MLQFLIFIFGYFCVIQSQSFYRYEIIVDHLTFPKRDELFDYGTLRVTKFNRTTYVITGEYDILQPFTDDIVGRFNLYLYQGNEYRKIADKKIDKICTSLKADKLVVAHTIQKTSLGPELQCPIVPQHAYFYDVNMPADFLPLQPPPGEKYRVEVMYFLDDKVLTNFSAYFLLKKIKNEPLPNMG